MPDTQYPMDVPQNKPTTSASEAAKARVRSTADPVSDHWTNSRWRVRLECGRSLEALCFRHISTQIKKASLNVKVIQKLYLYISGL